MRRHQIKEKSVFILFHVVTEEITIAFKGYVFLPLIVGIAKSFRKMIIDSL